jgi:RHS repeat-associated protein
MDCFVASTSALTDSSAALQTSYAYDPYGYTTTSGTSSDNSHQFADRQDDSTELHNYRARYYNPGWGRFISEDPKRFAEGANLYAYVLDNPVQFTDRLGLATFCQKARAICLAIMCYVTGENPPRIEITPPAGPTISGSRDPKK